MYTCTLAYSNHPVPEPSFRTQFQDPVSGMPWVQVTACVIDTSTYRAHADTEPTATPQRMGHGKAHCAGASPCTVHMSSKKQLRRRRDGRADNNEEGKDDEREDCRRRMMFRDLLREFYPRYGVSLKEEFGKSFKAAKTEMTFSVFPEPGVSGVIFR